MAQKIGRASAVFRDGARLIGIGRATCPGLYFLEAKLVNAFKMW